ncbi:DUF2809 domain-containing protein [Paenibacillus sp. PK3_47]|uniref:ribosomal maturation YjgA family protein n=1 Tax=Paenibacillus sp. PK3_47 TaxID=2072642 RepID=UPI00201D83AA|nr:DUF2809 domain-containing protein [Paenibacillus sp. PK3_47]UQZ36201.1 DUF2809 domain-containing protein [Paenibacillus sp. PK3_47]
MRARLICGCAVLLVMGLGSASRAYSDVLPLFIAQHAGDALWAGMIYFAFRFLLIRQAGWWCLIFSLVFSFGIEFSQLYQAEWINGLRSTLPGGLILGRGFLWADLLRYTAGIMICYVLDRSLMRK